MKTLFAFFAVLTISASASAGSTVYCCSGPVTWLSTNVQGQVSVTLGGSGLSQVTLCQIGATANGISSDTCKSMNAYLLAARLNGITVSQCFNDSLNCSEHPAWTYASGMWGGPTL